MCIVNDFFMKYFVTHLLFDSGILTRSYLWEKILKCQSKLTLNRRSEQRWIIALAETPNLFQFSHSLSSLFGLSLSSFIFAFCELCFREGARKTRSWVAKKLHKFIARAKLCVNNYEKIKNDLFLSWRWAFVYSAGTGKIQWEEIRTMFVH